MTPTTKHPDVAQAQFWSAVERCLIEFHNIEPTKAHRTVKSFRLRLEKGSNDPGLIYHSDPFTVASGLAASPLHLEGPLIERYNDILSDLGISTSL
jgi:hypothetical protein